jgi:predicted acyl esterase
MFRSGSTDGVALIEWVHKQPWCNGQLYHFGISADGIDGFGMDRKAPPLTGQVLTFASSKMHSILYNGGAYRPALTEGWLNYTIPKQFAPLDRWAKQVEAYGPFWSDSLIQDYSSVRWPTLIWAGWYDLFTSGQLVDFEGYQKKSHPSVRGKSFLVTRI